MGYLEDLACILRFNKTLIACSVAKMFRQYKHICNKCVNKSRYDPQLGQYVSPTGGVSETTRLCHHARELMDAWNGNLLDFINIIVN